MADHKGEFLLGDQYTLVDAVATVMLTRLCTDHDFFNVNVLWRPKLKKYMERMFARKSYKEAKVLKLDPPADYILVLGVNLVRFLFGALLSVITWAIIGPACDVYTDFTKTPNAVPNVADEWFTFPWLLLWYYIFVFAVTEFYLVVVLKNGGKAKMDKHLEYIEENCMNKDTGDKLFPKTRSINEGGDIEMSSKN